MTDKEQTFDPVSPTETSSVKEIVFQPNAEGVIEAHIPHVDLDSDDEPLRFSLTLEKLVTPASQGSMIESITIDDEGEKLQSMFARARELKGLPEEQRPPELMKILRENLDYAYDNVVENLSKTEPELAEWVAKNTGLMSYSSNPLKLSEIVEHRYAICRHMSAGLLALAHEAGLEGSYQTYSAGMFARVPYEYKLVNVEREDNGEPLFRLAPLGEEISGHAWVELKVNGEWIPYDPSQKLYGDTPEGLATFKKANYRALVGRTLEFEGLPRDVKTLGLVDLAIPVTEATHVGEITINAEPRKKPFRMAPEGQTLPPEDETEVWPKHTTYKGSLDFRVYTSQNNYGVNAVPTELRTLAE